MPHRSQSLPAHTAHVYDTRDIRVAVGANLGDAIGDTDSVEPGDVYRLDPAATATPVKLHPATQGAKSQLLAEGTGIGKAGEKLDLLSLLTLMTPEGDRLELLIVRHDPGGGFFAMPLSPMRPRVDYTLLAASAEVGNLRIADIVCVSFAAGTLITIPDGALRSIESLKPGDGILTRDHGPQPIRWIGKATLRAVGSFAPIVISAGTLGNLGDLVVSPHHRIFIYQRGERRLGATAELLVQAKHLVDGDTIFRREGGFVDYYSLVFDQHEIIYAEGIPAESLMVNDTTLNLLPDDLGQELRQRFPGLTQLQHFGTEARAEDLNAGGRAALLRRGKDDRV
ncbi:MAG: Hint domain-containing protein [Rhodobacteraceae bacterium]|nr:Hint domain-containing protein [Paracoccaceae bacterium]